jgi:hypothetical protein
LPYDGDIADTAALEKWVIGTVVPASRRQSIAFASMGQVA